MIWFVQSDRQPEALVDFIDVVGIFGWNHDGSKLLFARGHYRTYGELSDSAELWIYDNDTGKTSRLGDSTKVWSASWSPVDDRVAYCEYGNVITVISLDGQVLSRRENLVWDFTWSPDGSGIAVPYSGPGMADSDGLRTTTIAVWWLEKDELQLFSDAKFDYDSFPIWSMDGQLILFHRIFSGQSETIGDEGFYIVDINSRLTTYLSDLPDIYPWTVSRSPRSDTLAVNFGEEIYILTFDGKLVLIVEGTSPAWLPDGNTLIHRSSNGKFGSDQLNIDLVDRSTGGGDYSPFVNSSFDYVFFPEDQ
jgi:Tol biopolymer transport system component